jgi:endoribonuclease Dicer
LKKLDAAKIEHKLGYTFREKTFLLQAFTHSSYAPNKLTDSYERLEVIF